jgi:ABC-type bacteriocin/lantibiotic exporter with double-glycine peptidase domain
MAVPSINKKVFSEIIPMGATSAGIRCLLATAAFFVGVGLAKGVLQIVKSTFLSKTKVRLSAQAQAAVMARVLLQPDSFFSKASSGKLSVKIKNSRTLASLIIDQLFNTSITAIFSIQYIPQMLKYAPSLVVPALILLAVQLGISILTSLVAMNNEKELLDAQVENNNFTFQCMKGVQKIKGIGAESRIFYIWSSMYHRILKHSLNQPKLSMLSEPIEGFLSSITTIALLCMAILSGVPYADYTAFVASFSLASGVMETMVSSFTSIIRMQPKFRQLREIIQAEEESQTTKEYIHRLRGKITVDHLSFQYESATFSCIKDISLEIKPGEKVAFVGESGCGKSTLLKLLLGMERPDQGSISYDDIPMGQINLRSLRRHIGSVFQFSRVIPGTISENILFSSGTHSEEDVWKAAEDAAIAEDIRNLPLGLETEITDTNSGGFSGGQKQRILIARAFVSNPSILLLDEATSALDNLTQAHVLESVYKMKSTVIMVAHRLSTVKNCDRIIVFKDGRIEEEGNYEELIQKKGYFAKLVEKQTLEMVNR